MPSRKLHLVSEWKDESEKLRARYDRMAAEKATIDARVLKLQERSAVLADGMHHASERCAGNAGHIAMAEKVGAIAFEVVRDEESATLYLVYIDKMGRNIPSPQPEVD